MKNFTLLFILVLFLFAATTVKAESGDSGSVVIVMDSPIKENPRAAKEKEKAKPSDTAKPTDR